MLTVLAIIVSTALILWLCTGDPKRRRAAGLRDDGMSTTQRRLLAAAACLPGLLLAVTGHGAGFFLWLGGCGVVGWLIALGFGQRRAA
jgi:hypothetical protein